MSSTVAAVIKGIAPVIREYLDGVVKRLDVLEQKAAVPGPAGEPGPPGAAGPAGADGKDGRDGEPGPPGERGPAGEPGARGEAGPAGEPGADGQAGRDGRDGLPGPQGEKGLDGKDGIHGKDGAPGRDGTLENLKLERVNERTIRFCFKDGTPIDGGDIRLGHPVDRGVFKAGAEYEQGDCVTWDGSLWIAQKDTSAKPGTGSQDVTGWRLAVKRGNEGKQGPKGERGEFVTVRT